MAGKTGPEFTLRLDVLGDFGPGAMLTDGELARRAEHDDDVDLIGLVRDRLELGHDISDVTIAASLAQIGNRTDTRGRWLTAFGSPVGRHLAMRGTDLNTALNVLLGLAPRRNG